MRHSSTSTDRSTPNMMGAVVIGVIGALTMSTLTVATGHGLLLALLAYVFSGVLFMTAAAAGRLAIGAAAHRMAPARYTRRGNAAAA